MTALLETRIPANSPLDIFRALRERVRTWSEPGQVAQVAADLLRTELGRPVVTVYRREGCSGDLVLLGAAPEGDGQAPKGSRRVAERGVLGPLLRTGTPQRSLNYYVEPDFVRSLPGETRSALAVPLSAGQEVLGALHFEYSSPHTPSAADEEIAEIVAGYLAVAWSATSERADHGDAPTARRLREGGALADISGALARAEDFAVTQARIAAAACELLGCGGAMLLMKHDSRQMLELVARSGEPALPLGSLVPLDGTLVGQAARSSGTIEFSPRSATTDPVLPGALVPTGPHDALMVPVTSAGKTSGVLLVANSAAGAGFGAEDVRLAQALADQAGAADAIRSLAPLRQRISDASLIAEVGRAMTGTLGLDEVLAIVVRAAEMLVSGRYAAVALLSDDRAGLLLAAASGSLQGRQGSVLPVHGDVLGSVCLQGETLSLASLSADPRGWQLGDGFGPAVLSPLESRGQIRGVLLAGRGPGTDPLTDGDVDAVRRLGAYAAIAIDNARLYREQTELSRTLQAQAQELEKAYADLRASQERLLVSEKMAALGRVTAGIAHEINSPLGSILNCLQLATTYAEEYRDSAGDPEVTADDHRGIAGDLLETLELAEEATRRVGQFVRTIKGQTRMDEERVVTFDPAEEADGTILLLRHELDHGRITLAAEFEQGLRVTGDSSKFAVIVQNLVSNAIDSYEDGEGIVRVRLAAAGDTAVLEVEDHGSGIPEEIRPRIYDYLFTTKDIGRGTGLGLSLVHSIVTSHFRGRIDYRSEIGAGTTFAVTIPLCAQD
jgi:signal transduction histidine kinase